MQLPDRSTNDWPRETRSGPGIEYTASDQPLEIWPGWLHLSLALTASPQLPKNGLHVLDVHTDGIQYSEVGEFSPLAESVHRRCADPQKLGGCGRRTFSVGFEAALLDLDKSNAFPAECSACHDVPGVRNHLGSAYGERCDPAVT